MELDYRFYNVFVILDELAISKIDCGAGIMPAMILQQAGSLHHKCYFWVDTLSFRQ